VVIREAEDKPMIGSLYDLVTACAAFVGGHFLLSSLPIRRLVTTRLGEGAFRAGYSLLILTAFLWLLLAYGAAPFVELWPPPVWTRWLPILVMPVASLLIVLGLSTPSVTLVGGEAHAHDHNPAPGIIRITRHPFLWGTLLWALAHIPVNGDVASVILFGGIALLSAGGMAHIDHRRQRTLGAAWGPIALTTSVIPFAALLAGRTTFDWAGIGWWRMVGGLALFVALLGAHQALLGVSPLPA
jgi:uncharacterized membrane protein